MEVVVQPDLDADACYIGFDMGDVAKSLQVTEDLTLDFDADGRLKGLDVMNASKLLGARFVDVTFDTLLGVKEAADLAGVQRSNFVRDYASKAEFPKPVCELATGRIWLKSQVEAYLQTRKPRRAKAG